jgi:ribose 5-phosphate isomerase A
MSSPKEIAARAALEHVSSGMTVGLGTGSTATAFIQLLGQSLSSGRLKDIVGIPTSVQSDQLARSLNIPLVDFSDHARCDVTIDGADEIDPKLDLIKGLGGALLREKVVAQNSSKIIIIADDTKRVLRLGSRTPLPVEVTRFALAAHERFLRSLGCEPAMRRAADGLPFETDNGNYVLDCRFPQGITDAAGLAAKLEARAGIVEHGLFVGLASMALIATDTGTLIPMGR